MEKKMKKRAEKQAKAQANAQAADEAKRADDNTSEGEYSDEDPSNVYSHGGKKQPSDSEDEYQVDSGSDTTVNLINNSGGNVFSVLASGQV